MSDKPMEESANYRAAYLAAAGAAFANSIAIMDAGEEIGESEMNDMHENADRIGREFARRATGGKGDERDR